MDEIASICVRSESGRTCRLLCHDKSAGLKHEVVRFILLHPLSAPFSMGGVLPVLLLWDHRIVPES